MTRIALFSMILALLCASGAQADDINAWQAGEVRVLRLADKDGGMDKGKLIVPAGRNVDALLKDGMCANMFVAFLLRHPDGAVLLDTGNGAAAGGKTEQLLQKAGVAPEDLRHVALTHMHGDHIGGLLKGDAKAFPNAVIHVDADEFNYWTDNKNRREGQGHFFDLAQKMARAYAGQIKTFAPGERILPWLESMPARGHTPGHTAFAVNAGEKKYVFSGDIFHCLPVQAAWPDVAVIWDVNPEQAISTRKQFLEDAARGQWTVFGGHFAEPGAARFEGAQTGYKAVPAPPKAD